jgi:hypothetical protein
MTRVPLAEAAGTPRLVQFGFAFNTPNLATGIPVLAVAAGDVLVAAWITIAIAWDGTTPKADFGLFAGGDTIGVLAGQGASPVNMTHVDNTALNGTTIGPSAGNFLASGLALAAFTASGNLQLCVSQDGTTTGGDPGASQGVATLNLLVVTP